MCFAGHGGRGFQLDLWSHLVWIESRHVSLSFLSRGGGGIGVGESIDGNLRVGRKKNPVSYVRLGSRSRLHPVYAEYRLAHSVIASPTTCNLASK